MSHVWTGNDLLCCYIYVGYLLDSIRQIPAGQQATPLNLTQPPTRRIILLVVTQLWLLLSAVPSRLT